MRAEKSTVLACATLVAVSTLCYSQETEPLPRPSAPVVIQRLSGEVTLDGISQEPAWQTATPLPMVMVTPTYGIPPTEKSEILMGFDDRYLYVAGRLYDREASKVKCPSKKRDYAEGNTDYLGVIFDTFNDKENGVGFFTTPSGLRTDTTIYADAVQRTIQDMPLNFSWNTFWDSAVVNNEEGWFAEMRIPFSSLRFQDKDGRVVMGLIVWRWIAHKNEMDLFPAIYPKWGSWSFWKPSQAQEVVLEGVQGRNPLYITPYGLGGYGVSNDLNDEETAYVRSENPTYEAGLDVKVGLTSNLTLDLTLNPDFAQVEADDQVVNLTRFDVFFPERRLFFQERSSNFEFSFGEYNRLFYSRSIGIYDEKLVRIYGGARVYGRLGSWDVGLMDMQQAALEDLPSQNYGVLRLRRRVFNRNSYLGGMVTNVIGTDGTYNTCYGLDGILRVSEDDYFVLNWAQSFETGKPNDAFSLDPARAWVGWERRTQKGLGFNLNGSLAGKDYNPGMGFETRESFYRIGDRILYGWMPGEKSFLQSHNVYLTGFAYLRYDDHTLESLEFGPGWEFNTKSGWNGSFALKAFKESVAEEIEFSDEARVPLGEYSFFGLDGYFQVPMGWPLSAMVFVDAGTFYDGWRASIGVRPVWGISSSLSLGGWLQFNHAEFPDRHQVFNGHIAQLKLNATLSLKFSALAFVQYSTADEQAIVNVRLRYNPREGNDLYIVYNDTLNSNREREVPHRPFSASRAIMVKYSYTFNL